MVETSCCGLSLRTGSLLTGVYLLLTGIAAIATTFAVKTLDDPHKYFLYVIGVLSLIGAVTLLFGSFKCSRPCIKVGRAILFILTAIAAILLFLALLTLILNLFTKVPFLISIQKFLNWDMAAAGKDASKDAAAAAPIGKSLGILIGYLIDFLLSMYLFAVVNSFYHSLCQNCA